MRQQWNDVRLRYKDRLSERMAGKSLQYKKSYGRFHLENNHFFGGGLNGLLWRFFFRQMFGVVKSPKTAQKRSKRGQKWTSKS